VRILCHCNEASLGLHVTTLIRVWLRFSCMRISHAWFGWISGSPVTLRKELQLGWHSPTFSTLYTIQFMYIYVLHVDGWSATIPSVFTSHLI
jgi:hypothetical protein